MEINGYISIGGWLHMLFDLVFHFLILSIQYEKSFNYRRMFWTGLGDDSAGYMKMIWSRCDRYFHMRKTLR
jgi:hypothetical protein